MKREMKRIKRKKEESTEEMQVMKKAKLKWRREDCAKSIGKLIKLTGEGDKKKCHYETFEFHCRHYRLEDTVLLAPENLNQKNYVAIIKDIYVQEKDGLLKLEVQWLYRPEDIEKRYVGKWESKDSTEIFYSFHRDEVFAESVKHKCVVYFLLDDTQIPNLTKRPDFIVRKVYDTNKKKLRKFSDKGFDVHQKCEIDVRLAKTLSRIEDRPSIKKVQMTKIPRRQRSARKRCVLQAESSENRTEDNSSEYKPVGKKLESLPSSDLDRDKRLEEQVSSHLDVFRTEDNSSEYMPVGKKLESLPCSDLDRDKRLEELLEALLKHMCCANKGNQADDYEFMWPNNVIQVVFALEKALYNLFADDIPKYNYKFELLVEKIKETRVLAKRLLNGDLEPEQVIKMKDYELLMAEFEEPKLVGDVESTSKSVGCKDSLED